MAKIYKTDQEARQALLTGIRILAKLVTITLGPKGRNVALDRLWSDPAVIHDGVSVAREIELKDPFENMGAQLVKEAASKTVDRAGDGTTTATLLAWKLIEKGIRLIDEGHNPMMMKEGIDKAVTIISQTLTSLALPVKKGDIAKVATISAASEEIGKIIAEAVEKVGPDGVITVEDGVNENTTIEYKEGMQFDKGFSSGSPQFITNADKQEVEIEHPLILFTDMQISSVQDFADFLGNIVKEEDRNIVIIADSFQNDTLPLLLLNHKKGNIQAYAVQAPSFGIKRIWMLEDMAAITGGTVITRQMGRPLASITKEELGRADKVWADKDNTKIIGGKGEKKNIAARIASIKKQIETEESEFEKKSLKERIARLSTGAAIIHVGALTSTELKDKKERIIDAVEATKAAVAEGIVSGGGIALLQCQDSLLHLIEQENDPDISEGVKLVQNILKEPITKIIQNAGKNPETILDRLEDMRLDALSIGEKFAWGYDVVKNEFGDMFEMGIIDPVRVTRQALQNAASVASMILTIEGLITTDPEDKQLPAAKQITTQ